MFLSVVSLPPPMSRTRAELDVDSLLKVLLVLVVVWLATELVGVIFGALAALLELAQSVIAVVILVLVVLWLLDRI